jgi:hypothetical protein
LRWRTLLLATLVIAGVGMSAARQAEAAPGLQLGLTDSHFQSPDAGLRSLWLNRTVDASADFVLLGASWDAIAPPSRPPGFNPRNPGDPAYDWSRLDDAVREASARGLQIGILVNTAPAWAEGPGRPSAAVAAGGTWSPDPAAVADFGRAIASRYSGRFADPAHPGPALPRVRYWQLWAEPNISAYLNPLWSGKKPLSPAHYRSMLNAFYDAVHAVDNGDVVVTGGTAPYGDPPGGQRIRPLVFWRNVLCLRKGRKLRSTRCPDKAKFDVLATNPINTTGGPLRSAINPDDLTTPDLGNLRRLLRAAERRRLVGTRGHHPLWATEIWWESNPPDVVSGVPLGRQARWLEQAFYVLWKQGARLIVNFQIADAPYLPSDPASTYQTGIFFSDGTPKPSFTAFRFPFVAQRATKTHRRRVRVWGKAPVSGSVLVQRGGRRGWRTIRRLRQGADGIFTANLHLGGAALLRAVTAGEQSLAWRVR